jgi:hypothetical protein
MILQPTYAQTSNPASESLVKVSAKMWKTVTVVKIENSKDNIYSIRLVWLTLQNGIIESFKSVDGWKADTASNPNAIQFRTDTNPIKPGQFITFGIKSDQKNPIFKWIILDEDGDELGSGMLDVAKSATEENNSNGSTQGTNTGSTNGNTNNNQNTNQNNNNANSKTNQNTNGNTNINPAPEVEQFKFTGPARIALSPDVTEPGRVIRIMGEQFTPNSKLTVLFDGKQITKLDIGKDGKIRDRVLIPKDTVNGAHQISVSDAAGRAANIAMTVKIVQKVIEFAVKAEQQTYKQGDLVKINGTGKAGAAVQLTVKNPAGISILSSAVPVGKDSKYSAFIPLSLDATPGDYEVIAFQDTKTVKASFRVLTISNSILSVVTDKFEYRQGENIRVSGKAPPNKDVVVLISSPNGAEVFSSVVKANSNGTYALSLPVLPTYAMGKYSAVVKADNEEISISFTIVQGSVVLTVKADKEEYREGELLRISGKGKPNDRVSIIIKNPRDEEIKMSANTEDDGTYSALWLVPSSAKKGTYRIYAEQGDSRAETLFVISS